MKFKLPRPIFSKELNRILSREVRRQGISLSRLSPLKLKELAHVCQQIETQGLPSHLICKKLPHKLGSGIFLRPDAKPLLKGSVIGSYAGEVTLLPQSGGGDGNYVFEPLNEILLTKQEQQLFHKGCSYHPKRYYSLMIDALKKGNFTRFINHSEQPNVVAYLCRVPAVYGLLPAAIEVIYCVKKTIHPGEQLLVSYEDGEKSYWKACGIKPFSMTPSTFELPHLRSTLSFQ